VNAIVLQSSPRGGKLSFGTFVRIARAVKRWARGGNRPLFEGVGAVLTLGALLVSTAYLAIPRAAEPTFLPLPQPDRRVLARERAEELRLASEARRVPLSFKVRAVGDAYRRLGAGTVPGKGVPENILHELRSLAAEAQPEAGGHALVALRSVQAELFVAAAREWDTTERVSAELRELGGDFPEVAEQRGFRKGTRLTLDDEELATLFRMRWSELTQTKGAPPLAPSLDEYRAFYALLLDHAPPGDAPGGDRTALLAVAALEKLDPRYPAALARGVLLYRSGATAAAAEAFRDQLSRGEDGPFRLRARNHLLAVLAELPAEG
jgi:hypothetical protein